MTQTLDQTEAAVLTVLEDASGPVNVDAIAEREGLASEAVTGAAFSLESDGLVSVEERESDAVHLTDEGRRYVEDGLPERRLHDAVVRLSGRESPVSLDRATEEAGLDADTLDIALSNLARKGYGRIETGQVIVESASVDDREAAVLEAIADGTSIADLDPDVIERLERRNLISRREQTRRAISLTAAGQERLERGIEVADTVGEVTPRLLTSGDWTDVEFAEYNVEADAPRIHGGSEHVLRRMAERVKDVLVGMGFKEMQGPHIDADFWINDCLFMPQDHPARTHWDRFELAEPLEIDELPAGLVERVARAHREGVGKDGDGYQSPWDESVARELALRGHTTSLSARYLAGEAIGELEPPQRFFSVEKAYRNDTIDATHLLEFFQIEGWVMADELSARDLMGTFTEFYDHFGITDLEFKPHYNPYTEPSFELFGTHPLTGELIEIGNSGIFRPEMLEPLGVDSDVMAWGLALERLMMLVTGAEDIRDVHGTLADLDFLRTEQVVY